MISEAPWGPREVDFSRGWRQHGLPQRWPSCRTWRRIVGHLGKRPRGTDRVFWQRPPEYERYPPEEGGSSGLMKNVGERPDQLKKAAGGLVWLRRRSSGVLSAVLDFRDGFSPGRELPTLACSESGRCSSSRVAGGQSFPHRLAQGEHSLLV